MRASNKKIIFGECDLSRSRAYDVIPITLKRDSDCCTVAFGGVLIQQTRLTVPAATQARSPVKVLLTRLHESHHVAAYEALERLARAAEAAGFDADTLLGMFGRAMTFRNAIELTVSNSTRLQKAA